MRRAINTFLLISLLYISCQAQDFSIINEIANSFESETATIHLQKLTGEKKVWYDGDSLIIKSRHAEHKGNQIAEEYLSRQLSEYGYHVDKQNPFWDCVNIIATKQGTKYPDKFILIGAHYDSMPDYSKAPGADDNASGTVCVLEAARLFAKVKTHYSIIFAFWDEEESPSPMGSEYFVEDALDSRLDISEVINADMIAYDSNDDGDVIVNRSNFNSDLDVEELLEELNDKLDLNLDIHFRNTYTRSDDRAFAHEGFNTIGFIEKYHNSSHHPKNDFNPDWHTSYDTIENFNWNYYERNCKLIIGLLCLLSTHN